MNKKTVKMEKYDVVLSFAGQDRIHAKDLADLLESGGYSFFYDENEQVDLWGRELYEHLSSVYKDQGCYCVMFLSEHYATELWPNHERKSAQARAFHESSEYILPVRLDDTEIPGISPTVAYLDLRSMTIEEVYEALVKKLSRSVSRKTSSDDNDVPYPKNSKEDSFNHELDHDGDTVSSDSFTDQDRMNTESSISENEMSEMQHVFISYVRENEEIVDKFCKALESHGIKVWLDRNGIDPGSRWKQAIRNAIREGAFFIACFSKEYNERDKTYMNEELNIAIEELRKRSTNRVWFISAKLNECEILDRDIGGGKTLKDLQYVETYKDWDKNIQRIIDTIQPESSNPDANRKTSETNKPVKLFFSYAHEDTEAKDKLTGHLEELKHEGLIDIWHDNKILPGDKWREAITNNLAKSDILLYLVSALSLASENIKHEIAQGLNPNIRMIPIILEHCDWQNHQLSEFQALPDNGKPINEWHLESKGWQNVVEGIQKIVEEFTANDPNEALPKWLLEQGNLLVILEKYGKAIEAYTHAIKLNPDYTHAYKNRGVAYAENEQYDLAVSDYSTAIKFNNNDVELYYNRGNVYHKTKEHDSAIQDFSKVIEIKSDFVGAYLNRGLVYMENGDYKRGIKDQNKVLSLEPDNPNAYFNLGMIYDCKGDIDLAIEHFSKAIEHNQDFADAYNHRGVVYRDKKKVLDHAIKDFTKAIELNPKSADEYYNNRGITYRKKGEYERAIEDHNEAIRFERENVHNPGSYHYNRGLVRLVLQEWNKAKEDLSTSRDKQEDVNRNEFKKEYQYISDFEQEYNITLPEDIEAMLTPP